MGGRPNKIRTLYASLFETKKSLVVGVGWLVGCGVLLLLGFCAWLFFGFFLLSC